MNFSFCWPTPTEPFNLIKRRFNYIKTIEMEMLSMEWKTRRTMLHQNNKWTKLAARAFGCYSKIHYWNSLIGIFGISLSKTNRYQLMCVCCRVSLKWTFEGIKWKKQYPRPNTASTNHYEMMDWERLQVPIQ